MPSRGKMIEVLHCFVGFVIRITHSAKTSPDSSLPPANKLRITQILRICFRKFWGCKRPIGTDWLPPRGIRTNWHLCLLILSSKIRFIRAIRSFSNHSFRSDFTGFTVAARRLRKVTTAIVTPKTANSARANTQTRSGTW